MASQGNAGFASATAALFGCDKYADRDVIFVVDDALPGGGDAAGSIRRESGAADVGDPGATEASDEDAGAPAKAGGKRPAPGGGERGKAGGAGGGEADAAGPCRKARKSQRMVGEPLPAHSFVLRLTSECFAAQLDRWEGDEPGQGSDAAGSGPCTSSGRRELRVLLNSGDDEPAARAAIRFAYTGVVEADSVREALMVRRQAEFLHIKGGQAACDELLAARLSSNSSASSGAGASGSIPPVFDFFACDDLFPSALEGDFAPVMVAASTALARHFRDAIATLNTPSLLQQLQQLPAVAVEALLASKDFGTDTEDSVLLLLATWMKPNFRRTDADTRQRLAKLVRLVQLGRPYLTTVLPALAADYEAEEVGTPLTWFGVKVMEAAYITGMAIANLLSRLSKLKNANGCAQLVDAGRNTWDMKAPRYSFTPRPQCVPAAGTSFSWSISRSYLEQALAGLEPGGLLELHGAFAGGASSVTARGLEWRPCIELKHGTQAAGVFLSLRMPGAYAVVGATAKHIVGVGALDARLAVDRWVNGKRQDAHVGTYESTGVDDVVMSGFWGHERALPLRQAPAAAAAGGATAADPLAAWAEYLGPDGRITGTLTLLPPPRP